MKVTGTKCYVQIEDDAGNIARFDGEVCFGEFCALADSIEWVRHSGEATEQDRIDLIYQATRYGKDTGTRILFFSSDGQVMFEDELGLKTEVYCSKTYLVIVAVVVVSLLFPALLIAVLDVASLKFTIGLGVVTVLLASPFLVWALQIWRFRITAEGAVVTVRPAAGRTWQFSASDITRVVRKVKMGSCWEMVQKVRFYTKDKRVSLNQTMTGIEDMDAYLLRHVDAKRITTKKRDEGGIA